MSFDAIPGQARAKRMLRNALQSGSLSHAYIFSGPSGSGRSRMAAKLAQAVYCKSRQENGDPCGACIECRRVEHRNHPGLTWIDPDGASVKMEQIRDLQKEFGFKASGDQKKIYVIRQADRMTVQAANSLLKFLEEPAADVMAVLITENGQALLPTIQSRAQLIPFLPLGVTEMVEVLHHQEGAPLTLVLPAAHLSGGLEAARAFIQSKEFAEARNVVIQLGQETLTRFPHVLVSAQQLIFKSELSDRLPLILDLWLLWLKDMVHLLCGRKEHIVYIDQVEQMEGHAVRRGLDYWVRSMEHVVELQKRLRFHANPQLALERLIIELQGG